MMVVMDRNGLARNVAEVRLEQRLLRGIDHLSVHLDIAGHKLRIRHPELHEQADAAQDQEGDQRVPHDDCQGRTRLDQQLPRVAVEQAGRADVRVLADTEIDDHLRVGKQADEKPA